MIYLALQPAPSHMHMTISMIRILRHQETPILVPATELLMTFRTALNCYEIFWEFIIILDELAYKGKLLHFNQFQVHVCYACKPNTAQTN